jgi:raffinose/stachyose/melibiose transport system permease protein
LEARTEVAEADIRSGGALRARRRGFKEVPWLLALPALVALFAFHFAPVGFGGYYAFTSWNGLTHASWVGLGNFREIAADPFARGALWHTLELAGCFVVLANAIGLVLALGLNRAVRTRHVLRVLFFAPVALSPLAIAFIWRWIFATSPEGGGLNRILGAAGLSSLERAWTGDPSTALWTILIVMVWQFSGLTMVLYLAGLQQIPDELEEAALVDGATGWQRFRKIVLPLLAPAITVSVTLTFIIGMRIFDQILALTGGGPAGATETLATQVWEQTFPNGRFGYGAAISVILAALVAGLALIQLAFLRMNEQRL